MPNHGIKSAGKKPPRLIPSVMPMEKKTKWKNLITASVAALAISGSQLWVGINFSKRILWQSNIMLALVGSGPTLGYDASGRPMYEGTPVHMLAAYLGLLLGIVVYTLIFYLLLNKRKQFRKTTL
jgi:hypothetical protein